MNPQPSLQTPPPSNPSPTPPFTTSKPAEERLALLVRASFTAFGCRLEERQRNRRRCKSKLSKSLRRTSRRQGGKDMFGALNPLLKNATLLERVSDGDESGGGGIVGGVSKLRISRGEGNVEGMN